MVRFLHTFSKTHSENNVVHILHKLDAGLDNKYFTITASHTSIKWTNAQVQDRDWIGR